MQATITFDPTDANELERARTLMRTIAGSSSLASDSDAPRPTMAGKTDKAGEAALERIIATIADAETYGINRRGYLRGLAEAGDEGIDVQDWRRNHFRGSHQRYGGTHSSIEKSWKALGGDQFAPELISEQAGRQILLREARDFVLTYTADLAN